MVSKNQEFWRLRKMIQNFEKLDAELLEKFKLKSGVKIRGLVSTFDIKLVSLIHMRKA